MTYFGTASFPFAESCFLFESCNALDACVDCFTEEPACYDKFCRAPLQGAIGDNLLQVLGEVEEESVCEEACDTEEQCSFYTYFRANASLFSSTCYLLKELGEPLVACADDTCVTGTPGCQVVNVVPNYVLMFICS